MVSYAPSGSHHCGDTNAMTPPKPFGATPTTVKSMPSIRTVLPMNAGASRARRQTSYEAIATTARADGRSSFVVNARPAASFTQRLEVVGRDDRSEGLPG